MQKLTYNGTECNNYLYFSLDGEYFDTELVTIELNIEPTSVRIKKEPVPKLTSWKYKIEVGKDIDLETPLDNLINLFEPKIQEINKLKERFKLKTRLQFVIEIDINPDSSTPFFGLNSKVIEFLNMTETEVDFDLYKADTIGLLTKE